MKKYTIIFVVAFLVVLASAPSVYFYRQYQQAQLQITNPTQYAKEDAQTTVTAVSKLMLLPTDEDPTVMQVTDVSKLKDQPFFENAQNGDKVLVYAQARKVILYRSSVNKIIDVAPISLNTSVTPTPIPTPTPSPTPSSKKSIK